MIWAHRIVAMIHYNISSLNGKYLSMESLSLLELFAQSFLRFHTVERYLNMSFSLDNTWLIRVDNLGYFAQVNLTGLSIHADESNIIERWYNLEMIERRYKLEMIERWCKLEMIERWCKLEMIERWCKLEMIERW